MRVPAVSLPAILAVTVALVVAEDRHEPRPLPGNAALVYPEAARLQAITGEVVFSAEVDDQGTVTSVDIRDVPAEGLGFEEQVKETVRKWRFTPASVGGGPARGTYAGSIMFRLRADDEKRIEAAVASLAAAWNGGQVDQVLAALDSVVTHPLLPVPRPPEDMRAWLGQQIAAGGGTLKAAPRSIAFVTGSLAAVELTRATAGSAAPAPPLFGMAVRFDDGWRLVRLDSAAPTRKGPVRIGGAIKEPRKLKNVPPTYPEDAKKSRISGVVILEAVIATDGTVTDVQVLRGHPTLNGAAQAAVRRWVYTPTLLDGVAVPVIMTVTVNFRMQ